jgi:hypothetical protein
MDVNVIIISYVLSFFTGADAPGYARSPHSGALTVFPDSLPYRFGDSRVEDMVDAAMVQGY